MTNEQARLYAAIVESVYAAIDQVGMEGLRSISWFQSSAKQVAVAEQELEAA